MACLRPRHFAALLVAVALAGCTTVPTTEQPFPVTAGKASSQSRNGQEVIAAAADSVAVSTRVTQTPIPPGGIQGIDLDLALEDPEIEGEDLQVNYNNLPLPAFIHEVFGTQLNLSYTLDPALSSMSDLVTLRLADEVSPSDLFRIARSTLRTYGVVIRRDGDVLTFVISRDANGGETPLLISGRALPEVPDAMRPIFMYVPLEVVAANEIRGWLNQVLTRGSIEVAADPMRNAITLQGKEAEIRQALAIIESLDQPLLRGKFSASIEPAYVDAANLADNLRDILSSEGYDVSVGPPNGGIILLPLEGSNVVIVFAPSRETLDHVTSWAFTIDREQQLAVDQGIFSYEVEHARADYIVEMLNQLDAGQSGFGEPQEDAAAPTSQLQRNGSRFVVDGNRNAILFRGSGQEWLNLLPIMERMDQPSASVLVEVLIAEVTLTDQDATGIEWLTRGSIDINGSRFTSRTGTIGALSLGGSGINMTLDRAGETRAVINAFYRNERAEIRSRPRLMVKSGQPATIDIGTEIPVISSSTRSVENADAPVVQNVQYRKTGLTLTITPIVHLSGTVDIEIDQTLSESRLNNTSGIDSPAIFNRSIQTSVSLRDGGSVLLGGLVSSTGGSTVNGIPGLGKIPGLGRLFRTDSETNDRTELMILLVPHVIRDSSDGEELRELMRPELLSP